MTPTLPAAGWITPAGAIVGHYFVPRDGDNGVAKSLCLEHAFSYLPGPKLRLGRATWIVTDCRQCRERLRRQIQETP